MPKRRCLRLSLTVHRAPTSVGKDPSAHGQRNHTRATFLVTGSFQQLSDGIWRGGLSTASLSTPDESHCRQSHQRGAADIHNSHARLGLKHRPRIMIIGIINTYPGRCFNSERVPSRPRNGLRSASVHALWRRSESMSPRSDVMSKCDLVSQSLADKRLGMKLRMRCRLTLRGLEDYYS